MSSSPNQKQATENQPPANPFPGLRPFTPAESHLFFGREKQGEAILKQLSANHFVALIGASGSGKSSLIYCGLVSHIQQGNIQEAGKSWKVITTHPGNDPLGNLAGAIHLNFAIGQEEQLSPENITTAWKNETGNITSVLKPLLKSGSESILLVVDQFEEIFRYAEGSAGSGHSGDTLLFVDLLVEAVRKQEIPFYMVLTMRSDFIGDCSQFQNLTSLINKSNYLIPRMSRNDLASAITGPVGVGGATIEAALTDKLLQEIGNNPDQLPILQHALMRTWEYWLSRGDYSRPIAISDYEAIGKMERALSEHANEAYDELDDEGKTICESLFKTLTEKGTDNRGIRHPTRVQVIAAIAGTTPDKVIAVVEKFRSPGRSFLAPALVPLSPETIIDVSHESLMRIWNRLKVWVEEEATAVQMYHRLSEAAAQHQSGKGSLWRPPDLQLAINWKEKQHPSLTWAQRYNPAFERTMVFLSTSQEEFNKEEEHKLRLQKRQLRRTRMFALVLGSAAIIALGLTVYSQMLRAEALKQEAQAREAKVRADSNATVAREQEQIAREALVTAEQRKLEADTARMTAEEQRQRAIASADQAIREQKRANDKQREAEQQRLLAQANEKKANEQSDIAKRNSEEAFKRRMLSIAQSMSVKSLQINDDQNLKGLVAYQAYLFNRKYEGPVRQADIYQGLYDAYKGLNSVGFNVLKGHNDKVQSVLFLPGKNIIITSSTDGKLLRWDLADTSRKFEVVTENKALNEALAISPDGNWLACATDGVGIQLFDLRTPGSLPQVIKTISRNNRCLAFSFDSRSLFSSGADNALVQWDIRTLTPKLNIPLGSRLNRLMLSPDGNILASATRDGDVIFWNLRDSMSKKILVSEKNNEVISLAFGNNGKWLATGDKLGVIKIWDLEKNTILATLRGHTARVQDLAFSPDNALLGSVSYDASVRLWDMSDYSNPPVVLRDNGGYVISIAFSADGRMFLTGSNEEDRLVIRPSASETIADQLQYRIGRNMSTDEWKTYVGSDIEYEKTCKAPGFGIAVNNQ
ncbi:MAG: hypothetical protein U0T82_15725 [Bacteroidales bacterium]